MCDRDDVIVDLLFDLKPVKRLEYWGDVKMFLGAGNGTCKSILNMLKPLKLSDG